MQPRRLKPTTNCSGQRCVVANDNENQCQCNNSSPHEVDVTKQIKRQKHVGSRVPHGAVRTTAKRFAKVNSTKRSLSIKNGTASGSGDEGPNLQNAMLGSDPHHNQPIVLPLNQLALVKDTPPILSTLKEGGYPLPCPHSSPLERTCMDLQ